MSRIDSLPADQKAVLQLLLARGSRYEEVSGLLNMDAAAVRRRAHGALDALGPADVPGLGSDDRAEIADYLLGQQSSEDAAVTRGFLKGSDGGRAWARSVAGDLRALGGERLPEIPGEPLGDEGGVGEPAAGPVPAGAAAATPAAEPAAESGAGETGDAAAAFGAPAGDGGRAGVPRTSRRGGAILLGGLLIAAVAVVLLFVLRDSDEGGGDAKPAASTATTQAHQPQVVAQANLVPPSTRKGSKALGVVLVQRAGTQQQIVAAVQGLRKPASGGYGIWLYAGPGKEKWLGFFASQDDQGRLLARGELKEAIRDYREILVTREAKGSPPDPGPIFLRGPIQVARGDGG
jgi:hypothetical protein